MLTFQHFCDPGSSCCLPCNKKLVYYWHHYYNDDCYGYNGEGYSPKVNFS